ncbi:hypothetical protein AtubIFM61612_010573 [Aspergillus tubingensis]|nr:hypothetical protein AtubIFM61612_010573 [Aspergillus tubingensis]
MSMEEKSWSPSGEEIPPPLGDPNGPHPMSATPWMTETFYHAANARDDVMMLEIAQRRVARRILHQSVLYPRTPDRGHGGVDHIGKFEKNDWRGITGVQPGISSTK